VPVDYGWPLNALSSDSLFNAICDPSEVVSSCCLVGGFRLGGGLVVEIMEASEGGEISKAEKAMPVPC
jgi:hypothetical protein